MNEKLKIVLLGIGIYLLSVGSSYAFFSYSSESTPVSPVQQDEPIDSSQLSKLVFEGPKTVACPINGKMYTEERQAIWEKRRPLLIMVENHKDSRPQSGLSRADIVYEAVAEGGITRFMGVYYCEAVMPAEKKYDVGPVRSARTYFLDLASEYSDYPLYVHVGGAHCSEEGGICTSDPRVQALEQIGQYGWLNQDHHSDMNQFALSYHQCRREPQRTGETRATEHTMYCDTQALWEKAEDRGLTAKDWDQDFVAWQFKDDQAIGGVNQINFDFWKGYKNYEVGWKYDQVSNIYHRSNGGEEQKDFITGEKIAAKTVIVQFVKEIGPVDKHKHMVYNVVGTGEALVFQDGEVIKANWAKQNRQARTVFKERSGSREIEFNRGQIWIEILPLGSEVEYETS